MRIETERLVLRSWQDADLDDLVALNGDPEVMRFFGFTMSREASAIMRGRLQGWDDALGVTFWRVGLREDDRFLGIAGLKPLTVPWPEPHDVEIGWRFARHAWGQGHASEAAAAALAVGLARWPRVMAQTNFANRASWRVMERIGMTRAETLDFDHPNYAEGHPLRPHIVYVKAR
ncbi:GNAT family N-acetyltransferase [Sandaracinobacteroides saxicola]|uniref:GNAT family N-acetyltransferase n=1 Tax=Sandaracinobacteroides saxicola TaxID=2759707 RepID=A0A7G5IKC5_9SPHN|nr:GNAT family N-acetyltransferase [Sandaracinobacteroides saxicola]QMW23817.1 GNAT family N-acetyltransferase [Sandaracinobacteroides saxicola]